MLSGLEGHRAITWPVGSTQQENQSDYNPSTSFLKVPLTVELRRLSCIHLEFLVWSISGYRTHGTKLTKREIYEFRFPELCLYSMCVHSVCALCVHVCALCVFTCMHSLCVHMCACTTVWHMSMCCYGFYGVARDLDSGPHAWAAGTSLSRNPGLMGLRLPLGASWKWRGHTAQAAWLLAFPSPLPSSYTAYTVPVKEHPFITLWRDLKYKDI